MMRTIINIYYLIVLTRWMVPVTPACTEVSRKNCILGCTEGGLCIGGCKPGWHGKKCDKRCENFTYGPNCGLICGHCRDDRSCDPETGICYNGCVSGWRGDYCSESCNPYTYGFDCAQICGHCRLDRPCNMVTGFCSAGCKPGWTGDRCNQGCPQGKFGIDCARDCGQCEIDSACSKVSGICSTGCKDGYIGRRCDMKCPTGLYGKNCANKCGQCINELCDHVNGTCLDGCQEGWIGQTCQTNCDMDQFGPDCGLKCGHCHGDKTCDPDNGCSDGCKPGWFGLHCNYSCPEGYYGDACTFKCGVCGGSESCNVEDGHCPHGCADGYIGPKCLETTGDERRNKKFTTVPVLVSCIVFLVLLFSATIVYFICIRPKHGRLFSRFYRLASRSLQDPEPHVYEQVMCGPWELNKYNLILTGEKLGHGQFGLVKKGYVRKDRDRKVPVAVKSLKGTSSEKDKTDFMNELNILKKVGQHPNVVCLVGACHIQGTLYVAMEYAENGDLRSYLRKARRAKHNLYQNSRGVPYLQQYILKKFALDVSCGLKHLAEKQIIHRDVAARNVLLDDELIAKVADFGLSKHEDTYVKTSNTRVPVRWLAPESLFNATYTTQSDVWSFGILLWEIMSIGGTPYHGIDTQTLCNLLKQGYRIRCPRNCDSTMYAMMMQCWNEKPECRPTFHELSMRLQRMVEDSQIYMNIETNEGNQYAEIGCGKPAAQDQNQET